MDLSSRPRRAWTCFYVAGLLLVAATPAGSMGAADDDAGLDLVAVGTVGNGRAILLATPGLPHAGRLWRLRSFETSDLPQPIWDIALAASGTKLFLQPAAGPGVVLDLTRQHRHNVPLQYVNRRDLAGDGAARGQSHRLPAQRFVSIRDGMAYVVDDSGAVQPEYPVHSATRGAISEDGVVLYVRADRTVIVCGEAGSSRAGCHELPARLDAGPTSISARSVRPRDTAGSTRFLLLTGPEDHTRIIDPEQGANEGPVMRRAEAALRACLALHEMSMSDRSITSLVDALLRETAETSAASSEPITDWRFFRVAPDEELYAPVLQFARQETVFPSAFEMVEELGGVAGAGAAHTPADMLYDRYLRLDLDARRQRCTTYFRTRSTPGSWIIEYWLYYPFDVGGLGAHLHDPEHLFVEVDKLGSAVRRVIGAGHGYMAGNNIYTADRPGALAVDLPLFAIVELGKHATAPDMDRDGVFTPGLDENEYRERAKIWGVRDVIGTINNQLLPYDRTMSASRRPDEYLAPSSARTRFPNEPDLAAHAWCRLEPMPAGDPDLPACSEATTDCAKRYVTSHPDFRDVRTILKEWVFPQSFLRASYGLGPRRGLHSVGLGYAADLDRMPGLSRFLPLPGRVGGEVFFWRQDVNASDRDSCLAECTRDAGVGWGVRYEQFLSNLFGIFSAVRVYSPPVQDPWITFGPLVEVPLGNRSNVSLQAGLSFRPAASPRFDLKVNAGLWKPKTNHVGIRARKGDGS